MLKVGSRRTWLLVEREASKRREAWRRINLAEARSLYPSVAAAPARYNVVERSSLVRGGAGRRIYGAAAKSSGADEIEQKCFKLLFLQFTFVKVAPVTFLACNASCFKALSNIH
jgi:hypothetical protein